ncbi:type II toxin-antitoxin system RelE/ParE family toxin [Thiomicrospira sp. ALE5]|uniref:type II toxin-antitoxin system RelE/ParE family toxin n=1 Tax=Thiomicrospira sp. ALE5 TaxID=748650 RepID=UPI0008E8F901|nr:type II toxin-antitoxin system RelE/ParE family toxin [Thiomicrospira sp. ALE5]SFR52785.1 putative addiction module killer protein [Thiomicrospira sp. ALE5]
MNYKIETSTEFDNWLSRLKDRKVKARLASRFARIENGNFGDWSVTTEEGVFELRFFFGSGFRVYYALRGETIVLLHNGGDKSTQSKDIAKAKQILDALQEQI